MLLLCITACGFLRCQPDCSGMDCAFLRGSWRKVEPRSRHSSPSALLWSSLIRDRHNNPQPHPQHCPRSPWLRKQLSPNFARPATSAGNQTHGQGVTFAPIDCTVRKNSILTRSPKGCADLIAEVSDHYSADKPSHHSVAQSAQSMVGKSTWSMATPFTMEPSASDSKASTRRN